MLFRININTVFLVPYTLIADFRYKFVILITGIVMVNKFLETYNKLQELNRLIEAEQTGTPKELSKKINITERQLQKYLEILKELKHPVKYARKRKTYYFPGESKFKGLRTE